MNTIQEYGLKLFLRKYFMNFLLEIFLPTVIRKNINNNLAFLYLYYKGTELVFCISKLCTAKPVLKATFNKEHL